jgi:hypothetical protein
MVLLCKQARQSSRFKSGRINPKRRALTARLYVPKSQTMSTNQGDYFQWFVTISQLSYA